MDVLTLSRFQFALTIGIHYIYPPLSIGLGVVLVFIEAMWLTNRNPLYQLLKRQKCDRILRWHNHYLPET